ncbi:MAG: DinB family protein [Anaerolineae bacterium]|nr:DinB family protein [Anaerolineae bacterium]
MTNREAEWSDTLLHLLALAARLEGEGQYNMAKLARATAESLTRQAAFKIALPSEKDKLAGEVEQAIAALSKLGLNKDVLAALKRGGTAMADGRLPLITETPHPYVCRTCGHIVLKAPAEKCSTCGAWPTTFKQFLPVYWLDALEPFAALERLRQTPLDVAVLLEGLPEDALSCPPADGGWAIRNVVSHLRDAQGVLSFRLSLLLEQENPLLESKAVFAWATNEEERSPTTQEIFEVYRASRQETIAQLESLPLSDWWRTGQHEEFGPVTLRQQVSYFAAHEMTHLPQIEALRRRYSAAGIIR